MGSGFLSQSTSRAKPTVSITPTAPALAWEDKLETYWDDKPNPMVHVRYLMQDY